MKTLPTLALFLFCMALTIACSPKKASSGSSASNGEPVAEPAMDASCDPGTAPSGYIVDFPFIKGGTIAEVPDVQGAFDYTIPARTLVSKLAACLKDAGWSVTSETAKEAVGPSTRYRFSATRNGRSVGGSAFEFLGHTYLMVVEHPNG